MDQEEAQQKKLHTRKEILAWVKAVLIAFLVAWFIRGFVFEHEMVDGNSMNITLQNHQHLIIYKLGYYFHNPKRGDIVTLQYDPGNFSKYLPIPDLAEVDYIKRVIGLPGETVDIRNNHVYINGKELKEPYAKGDTRPGVINFPLVVPKNEYFVLGDNREDSTDSRYFGPISKGRIRGKAVLSVWPFKEFGGIYGNFSRDDYQNLNQ